MFTAWLLILDREVVKDDTVGSGRFPPVFYMGLEITKVRERTIQKRRLFFVRIDNINKYRARAILRNRNYLYEIIVIFYEANIIFM